MKSKSAIMKAPSATKYLVLDSSSLLAQTRRDRARQTETITRAPRARPYNSELRRAIALALTEGSSTR